MKRSRHISLKECYGVLLLEKGASLDDVKRAYRRRAFELHPDLNPGNADAARQFQRLNEAYVTLSQVLQTESASGTAEAARADGAEKEREQEARGTGRTDGKAAEESSGTGGLGGSPAGEAADEAHEKRGKEDAGRRARKARTGYAQEDVLRDLLNDPFARRVFEDIYSEVNRQAKDAAPEETAPPREVPAPPPPPSPRRVRMEWGRHKVNLDLTHGVAGAVKGWLRQQIDEEQTFKLPAYSLVPGARIRLQIRRGLSEELSTVEIILPRDFVMGRPVRLRGLGKKVGPWQGDLYLTLEAK